jgi:hypothetical protein
VAGAREKLLDFALGFPETATDRPWEDDVVVKVRGKIFVFLGPEGSRRISLKLAESHEHALARRPPRLGRGELPDRRAEEARRSA